MLVGLHRLASRGSGPWFLLPPVRPHVGANDPAISCSVASRQAGRQGTADMPNLFALMSDESDHPIAGDKLRGNDEGRTGGLEGEGSPEGLVFPLSPGEGAR